MVSKSEPEWDGASFAAELSSDLERLEKEELVRDALKEGVRLREYSKKVEKELRQVEVASVRDYMQQSSQVADLHSEMQKCDGILAKMQEMLLGFEADLGSVSSEIRQLQRESVAMSSKLKNRRAAEERLGKFLESLAFAPALPTVICDGDVDDDFVESVLALDARLAFVGGTTKPRPRAVTDVTPALDKLKIKACGRSRDYLVEKMSELRKLQTNIQVLQRTQLVKFAALFGFLERHQPDAATEVREFYVDSMSRALQMLFKAYDAELAAFDLEVANKHDLVAVDESAVRSTFTTKVSLSKRGDGFSLGDRVHVLSRLGGAPLIAHVARAENKRYPFEELFRSAVKHLMDAVTSETDFVRTFFANAAAASPKTPGVDGLVSRICGKAASAALEYLENKLFQCYDVVGLLLVARIVHACRADASGTVLSHFLDHCDSLLKPRLASLFAANLDSARRADPYRLGVNGVITPLYASRRYAELSAAVSTLFPADDPEKLHGPAARKALDDLRREIDALIDRVAASFKNQKERYVFKVNNYDQIVTIFHERRVNENDAALRHFLDKLKKDRELFVEAELLTCFAKLIQFVKHAEQHMDTTPTTPRTPKSSSDAIDPALVDRLVRDFAATWKTAIDKIHNDILAYFSNFVNGMEVLKQLLTQLLLYYTRFQKIIQAHWRRPPPFAKDLIPTETILAEIPKYSHTF